MVYRAAASGSLMRVTGWIPAFFAACRVLVSCKPSLKSCDPYLQSLVFGLVGPHGRDAEYKLLVAKLEVIADTSRLNLGQCMIVYSTKEVRGNIDRVLREAFKAALEAASRHV
jgi:hypothetical protein